MTKTEKAHDTTSAEPATVPGDNSELRSDQLESVAGGAPPPAEVAAVEANRMSGTPTWNAGWDAYIRKQNGAGLPPSAQGKA